MVTGLIDSKYVKTSWSVGPFQWKHCRYLLLQALPAGFLEKLEPVILEIKMWVKIVMDWYKICNKDIEQWSGIPCRLPSLKDSWSLTRPWQLQHPSFIYEWPNSTTVLLYSLMENSLIIIPVCYKAPWGEDCWKQLQAGIGWSGGIQLHREPRNDHVKAVSHVPY